MASEREGGPAPVPPPVFYVTALMLGLGLNYLVPAALFPAPWSLALGIVLVVSSVLIIAPVVLRFRRAGTPFDVRKPASALVTDGPYRFSRHPGYVALTLFFVGLSVLLSNAWALLLCVLAALVTDRWVIRKEERHLETRFGDEYRRYRAQVRRWL